MILGVDVFSGYGVIDWAAAAQAGVRFAYVKCTEGNEARRDDTAFTRNVAGCKAAGVLVGSYHFPYPLPSGQGLPVGRSPREQAERAYEACGGLGERPGELPHAVDAEWPEVGEWGKWGCTAKQLSDWLREYCIHATLLWSRQPIIYTYPFWWKALAGAADVSWAAEYDLWIANYTHPGDGLPKPHEGPIVPAPWTDYAIHQFSADKSPTRVPGIPVCPLDRNVIRDEETLRRLARLDETPTEPAIVPAIQSVVDLPIVHPKICFDDDDENLPP